MVRVLIVAKKTNLELHGEKIRKCGNREELEALKKSHEQHYEVLDRVKRALDSRNVEFLEVSRGLFWPEAKVEVVMTVGGDGTILEASHHLLGQEILLGFRSSERSVGYLCAGGQHNVEDLIEMWWKGKIEVQQRERMMAVIHYAESSNILTTDPALNDFLYAHVSPAETSRYQLTFEGRSELQKSSGLWISTATGSSAALKAAGGEVLQPEDKRFQFVVRELYDPHGQEENSWKKGFFDPDLGETLSIENLCDTGMLAVDGQHGCWSLAYGDHMKIKRAPPLWLAKA